MCHSQLGEREREREGDGPATSSRSQICSRKVLTSYTRVLTRSALIVHGHARSDPTRRCGTDLCVYHSIYNLLLAGPHSLQTLLCLIQYITLLAMQLTFLRLFYFKKLGGGGG